MEGKRFGSVPPNKRGSVRYRYGSVRYCRKVLLKRPWFCVSRNVKVSREPSNPRLRGLGSRVLGLEVEGLGVWGRGVKGCNSGCRV